MIEQSYFKKLFEDNFDALRAYIFYRTGDEECSSDIAQEAFMTIWEKQNEWKENSSLKALLYKIASDRIITNYRKNDIHRNYLKYMKYTAVEVDENSHPEQNINFEETKNEYTNALNEMSESQRTAFLMNREQELKYKDIAETLNISQKAVEKRITGALKILKKHLLLLIF